MLNKFLKNFPPPKYINVPYTGIVFSDNSIRMLALDKKNKHPVFFSEVPLEEGIIEMGKVKNEEALSKIFSEKKAGWESPFVRFSIPEETSYIFTAEIPVLPGKDARESVSFILEENVPLPLGDISFDFAVQKIDQNQNGYLAKVAVIAISTSVIAPYISSLRKAGLEPLLCVNESQATAYSVMPRGSHEVGIIVHIHKQSAGIYIVNSRLVEFSSVVSISPALSSEDLVELIKAEVLKAIDYWSAQRVKEEGEPNILHCRLCGEYENIMVLSKQICEIKDMNSSLANVWVNAFSIDDYIPEISFDDSLRFASAVGLFLSD